MATVAELALDLRYDGDALRTHEMDVRDLAPALLSAGELFQAVNGFVHPADPPVSVTVRALTEGSFLVQLKLVYDAAADALLSDDVQAGVNLAEILAVVGGLINYIRYRGRSPEVRRDAGTEPGLIRITFQDGTTLEIPSQVLALQDHLAVRSALAEVTRPLTRDGVDIVQFRQQEIVIGEVTTDEVGSFLSNLPPPPREVLNDNERETFLTILSPTFQPGTKWRLSEGGSHFYATLSDRAFQEQVDEGRKFSKQDVLRARIRTTQWRDDEGLHQDVEVLEVLEHLTGPPKPKQITMDLDPGDDPQI